jgi:Mlc titration factor MtfA (ptsG expression regulator)
VVLAWDAVERSDPRKGEGLNVVLHEFAHQLDHGEGLPELESTADAAEWTAALAEAFEEVRGRSARGKSTFLDEYGATDPAEFFAVATEAFFERSVDLRRRHRRLYAVLSAYYRQDPAAWTSGG